MKNDQEKVRIMLIMAFKTDNEGGKQEAALLDPEHKAVAVCLIPPGVRVPRIGG